MSKTKISKFIIFLLYLLFFFLFSTDGRERYIEPSNPVYKIKFYKTDSPKAKENFIKTLKSKPGH